MVWPTLSAYLSGIMKKSNKKIKFAALNQGINHRVTARFNVWEVLYVIQGRKF